MHAQPERFDLGQVLESESPAIALKQADFQALEPGRAAESVHRGDADVLSRREDVDGFQGGEPGKEGKGFG